MTVAGDLLKIVDRGGNETTITYDKLGQRRTMTDPDVGLTTFDLYDAGGNLLLQTTAAGSTTWTFDALNRPMSRVDASGSVAWTYDALPKAKGLLVSSTDSTGVRYVEDYDRLGRVLRERYERDGKVFSFETTYTPQSEVATRKYPTNRVIAYERDAKGYLTGIRNQSGSYYASSIQWEADGRPRRWTLGNGARTEYAYDPITGRIDRIQLIGPTGTTLDDLDYSFDPGDRVVGIAATTGPFAFSYDTLNRLTQATGPYGTGLAPATLQYDYDNLGNLRCLDASDRDQCVATGGTAFAYPAPGPTAVRPHAATSINGQLVSYSGTGNLLAHAGRSYEYDVQNELVRVRQNGALQAEFQYDASGSRVRSVDRSNARNHTRLFIAHDFDWDATYALAQIHLRVGDAHIATQVDPFDPAQASALAPRPPPRGLNLGLLVFGPALLALLFLLGQLVAIARRGQRLWRQGVASTTCIAFYLAFATPASAQTWIPDGDLNSDGRLDAADALLSVQLATEALEPTPAQAIRGDVAPLEVGDEALNAGDAVLVLRAANGEDVDGDGLAAEHELGAGASPFLADTDEDGVSDFAEVMENGTDPRDPDTDDDGSNDAAEHGAGSNPRVADTDGDGIDDGADAAPRQGTAYQHTDHLGSSTVQLDANGGFVRRVLYRPFGAAVSPAGGSSARVPTFGFTGQRFESALGIYDYKARWYNPALGRFMQPDPMIANLYRPQALHPYSYVENDPLNAIDPTGQLSIQLTSRDDDWDVSEGADGGGSAGDTGRDRMKTETPRAPAPNTPQVRSTPQVSSTPPPWATPLPHGVRTLDIYTGTPDLPGAEASWFAPWEGVGVGLRVLSSGVRLGISALGSRAAAKTAVKAADDKVTKTVIERRALGADKATSRHIIERSPDGTTRSVTHQVTKDGKTLHQHQKHIGKHGSERTFPDDWIDYPKVD